MKNTIKYMIAALLGTSLAGCQIVLEEPNLEDQPQGEKTYLLTVQATNDLDTKAMNVEGNTLTVSWKNGERINVFLGGTYKGYLEVTSADGVSPATLSGPISEVSKDDVLTLIFPGRGDKLWTYNGQDGTQPDATGAMATGFDYATASLTVDSVVGDVVTINGTAAFKNQQSIYRFGFKVGGAGDHIAIKSLILSSNQGKLVTSRSYVTSAWTSTYGPISLNPASTSTPLDPLYWIAVRNENATVSDSYSFSIVGTDNALYEGTKAIPVEALGSEGNPVYKFISAQNISVSAKAFAPAVSGVVATINEVL